MEEIACLTVECALKVPLQMHLGGSVGYASNFGSGHNLVVHEFEPHIGLCADSLEPALDSVSTSLPLPYLHSLSVSQK